MAVGSVQKLKLSPSRLTDLNIVTLQSYLLLWVDVLIHYVFCIVEFNHEYNLTT